MEAFPDAKVLLTVRNTNSWYKSVSTTIYTVAAKGQQTFAFKALVWLVGKKKAFDCVMNVCYHRPPGFDKSILVNIGMRTFSIL
jgi:hypothetical protein